MSKNITLAVDEEVLRKVRRIAANRDTTVNALVRKYLEDLAITAEDHEKQRLETLTKLREMSRNSGGRLGKDYKFDREELYAERIVR